MIITFPRFVLATKEQKKQDGGDGACRSREEGAAAGGGRVGVSVLSHFVTKRRGEGWGSEG